ncbi:hypothetical protein BY996DRAFT_6440951 [Phakopsora pachyrhizi]|nr:hypothetical protein BY996DRAFT_6440951 [Phakopsora pachyrhizi]
MNKIYYIQNQSTAMVEHRRVPSRKSNKVPLHMSKEVKDQVFNILGPDMNIKQWEDHEHHGDYEELLEEGGEGRLTTLGTGMSPTATVILESGDGGGVGGAIAGGEGFEWGPKTSLASTGSLSVGKEGLRGSIAQWGLVLAAIRDDRLPNGHHQFCDKQLINTGSKDLHDKTYQAVNPKEWQGKRTGRLPLTGEKTSCTIEQYKPARIEPIYARRQLRRDKRAEGRRGKGKLKKRRYGEVRQHKEIKNAKKKILITGSSFRSDNLSNPLRSLMEVHSKTLNCLIIFGIIEVLAVCYRIYKLVDNRIKN